ncbi:MAG: HlyD family efflux transporter periplasmic adaptor subunit [Planctomycetales bacterium]|nr:HlyD family efflux transporter periplasmic adaptor subunit [Planctomycetales bacterium]
MKRIKTKLPWALAMVFVSAMLTYGFWPEPISVDLAKVERGRLLVTVDDDGETRIREKYIVSAPVSGKLLRIELHPGDVVHAGVTELARIEPNSPLLLDARSQAESEARLRAATAALERAEATLGRATEQSALTDHEYDRAKQLLESRAISRAQFDTAEHNRQIAQADVRTAEYGVQVAEFEVEQARAAAARYSMSAEGESDVVAAPFCMVSPIDGKVLRVFQEDAGSIATATPLLELGNPQDLEMEIDVLSTDAVKVKPGDRVFVEHWGGDKLLEGVVRVVEPSAFLKISALGVEEKRVNIIADFVDPWSSRQMLGDGFRIDARIVVASTADDSLLVPAGTLFREQDTWHVYRVTDGVAASSPAEIGETNGLQTEIRSGLNIGDVLILHPTNKVRNGASVVAN